MKVVITKDLGDDWFDREDEILSDQEIIELLQEDLIDLLDGATWEIQRDSAVQRRGER